MKLKQVYLCLTIVLLAGCNNSTDGGAELPARLNNIKNSKTYNNGPVVLFGDSIARGQGSSSSLKSLDGCFSDAPKLTVVNKAVDGATSTEALKDIAQTLKISPALIVLSLGGNDIYHDFFFKNFPEQLTLDNMQKVFSQLTAGGSVVLHIGLNPPRPPNYPLNPARLLKIKQVAEEEGVIFLENSFAGLWENSKYMADDTHPNDAGYAILCDRIKSAIEPHFIF